MRNYTLFPSRVFSNRLRDEMGRLFDEFSTEPGALFARAPEFPAVNIWEDEARLYVEAELPGLDLNDVEILLKGNELTLGGERKHDIKEVSVHRSERGTGKFRRTLHLPVDVDANNVDAKLVSGVLTIALHKAEKAKIRKIEIKSG